MKITKTIWYDIRCEKLSSFHSHSQAGRQLTHMSDSLHEYGSVCGEWLSRSGGSQRDELGANRLFKTASSHPPLKAASSSHRDVPAARLNGRSAFRAEQSPPPPPPGRAGNMQPAHRVTRESLGNVHKLFKVKIHAENRNVQDYFCFVFIETKKKRQRRKLINVDQCLMTFGKQQ